jgi:hypothetical protein
MSGAPDVRWQPAWSDNSMLRKPPPASAARPKMVFGRVSASLVVILLVACTLVALYDLVLVLAGAR